MASVDYYLEMYKYMISDYIVSSDDDLDNMTTFLNNFVDHLDDISSSDRFTLKQFIYVQTHKYFNDQ